MKNLRRSQRHFFHSKQGLKAVPAMLRRARVSGAVVLGPVGAVAGAFIGYTAGPAISRSWGVGRSASRSRVRRVAQSAPGIEQQAAARPVSSPVANPPQTAANRKAAPPVQGLE
jgi:hypothetical protein